MATEAQTPAMKQALAQHQERVNQLIGVNQERLDHLQEERHAKIHTYVDEVVRPLGQTLLNLDPESSVSVSGSYAQTAEKRLRTGSDCDFLVVSSCLEDPDRYIQFLMGLREANYRVVETHGILPVYFTQVSSEELIRAVAEMNMTEAHEPRINNRVSDPFYRGDYIGNRIISPALDIDYPQGQDKSEHFLPVHLLFYPSRERFLQRESEPLAKDLLRKSETITGTIDRHVNGEPVPERDRFDQARWNVERALAELIPNFDFMPPEVIARKYKQMVLNAIRGDIGDTLYHGTRIVGNTQLILEQLEKDFDFCQEAGGVGVVFADILDIHENDRLPAEVDLDGLVNPGYMLLRFIDRLEWAYKTMKGSSK